MVRDAVRSVLEQTWRDLELVVVDDGSTDKTPETLARFDDPRLTVVSTPNRGVSAARNTGIAQSRGQMIALLDSDDHWLPDKLEIQAAYMKEQGLDICQTEEIWIRRGKRVNPGKKHAKPEGRFFEKALEMCLVSPSCVMFTRKYWELEGPFDETMPACEDYDLWLRTLLRHPVGLVRKALTVKRGGRPDQLSMSVPNLDLYRIYAIIKVLEAGNPADKERDCSPLGTGPKGPYIYRGLRKTRTSGRGLAGSGAGPSRPPADEGRPGPNMTTTQRVTGPRRNNPGRTFSTFG